MKQIKKASVPFFTPWIAIIVAVVIGVAYVIFKLTAG